MIKIEGTATVPHLVLIRPKVNALNADLLATLKQAIDNAVAAGAKAIVLTGEGKGFSAGADLSELTGTAADVAVDERIASVTTTIVNAPIPIIAALHGFCFGGAVDVAWSCDMVVATPQTRLAVPAVRLGILYNPPAFQRIYARIGSLIARRLFLFGDELSGEDAWRLGAVAHLAQDGDVRGLATRLAEKAILGQPAAMAASKQFLNDLDAGTLDLDAWQEKRKVLLDSAERRAQFQSK